jgi:DNA gyrase inhibitor GyrI
MLLLHQEKIQVHPSGFQEQHQASFRHSHPNDDIPRSWWNLYQDEGPDSETVNKHHAESLVPVY